MKSSLIIIMGTLFLAIQGRAQVVLPSSSEYDDPYTYYRDCIDKNGESNGTICEQQTGALFPSEDQLSAEEPMPAQEGEEDVVSLKYDLENTPQEE